MTTTENAGPGRDFPARSGSAAATEALNKLLAAPTSVQRLKRYADLLDLVTTKTVAVYDGHCSREGRPVVAPLGTFFRACLRDSTCRDHHTPDNCRWATADDMPYDRYPLIGDCWKEET